MPRLITSRVSERRSRHVKDPDSRTDCTLGCSVRFWGRDAWGARVRTLDRDVSAGVSVRSSGPSESFREPLGAGCANFDPMAEIRLGVEGFILRTAVSKGDAGSRYTPLSFGTAGAECATTLIGMGDRPQRTAGAGHAELLFCAFLRVLECF